MKSPEGFTLLLLLIRLHIVISLTCHRAEYQIGERCCPMCPPGFCVDKHCTERPNTYCRLCDEGTYMDEPSGRTQCFRCQTCPSGSGLKVKTACSSDCNTVCEAQDGHFCLKEEDGSCRTAHRHKSCEPGEFIQKPGSAFEDTQCSSCPEGTFSHGTESSCQPHTQCGTIVKITLKKGTLVSDAECGARNFTTLIIVAVVGAVVLLIAAPVAVVYLYKKKGKTRQPHEPAGHDSTTVDPESQALNFSPDQSSNVDPGPESNGLTAS